MEKGWKEVFMTSHEYKAEIAREILENDGIKPVVLNQHDSAYQAFGEFIIYVAAENEVRSIELLKELKN